MAIITPGAGVGVSMVGWDGWEDGRSMGMVEAYRAWR